MSDSPLLSFPTHLSHGHFAEHMKTRTPVRFNLREAEAANDAWRFNCGPSSLCAALGMTPAEIRPHLLDFESRGVTTPTLMMDILNHLSVPFATVYRGDWNNPRPLWPCFGLMRIQFDGPWTAAGAPMKARYRATHWVAVRSSPTEDPRQRPNVDTQEVFDINGMHVGGWIPYIVWESPVLPDLIRDCHPRASGAWWPTHCLELDINNWRKPNEDANA